MKPASSFTMIGCLPHAVAKADAVSMVSSEDVSARTTSTRGMTGAGLKKWMPHTDSGRPVATASSITGRADGPVELPEQRHLGPQVLDHAFEDQVAVGEVGELARHRDPRRDLVGLRGG